MVQDSTSEAEQAREPLSWPAASTRLAIGLVQGVGLYLLSQAEQPPRGWPADHPPLFAALTLVLAFVPLIGLGGVGRIRPVVLTIWAVAAAAILAAFAYHDLSADIWSRYPTADRLLPSFQVFLFGAVLVFVGHHLIGPADAERRLIAPYPAYFDWAWKDAVQIVLSVAFVGVLWASLELGAQLFKLIGVEGFSTLIAKPWFAIPVTSVAFAAAIQLTDVRIGLIRGVRTVGLVLLSWLLPVMTLIAVGFLAALPLTGLQPLFGTRSATETLLAAAAVLIVLTSTAYQDGQDRRLPAVLRYSARAAGVALAPLIVIAAFALWLRIREYGLTPERIAAAACALIGAGYAAGYAFAGLNPKTPWMRPLERTNVVMAAASILVIAALFTPIADPARLAVDDQVGRVLAGRVSIEQFDFKFLRFGSGRYGCDALQRLVKQRTNPALASAAAEALIDKTPSQDMVLPQTLGAQFHVYPKGAVLPAPFLKQDWSNYITPTGDGQVGFFAPACFQRGGACDAYLVDLDGDGVPEILLSAPYSSDLSGGMDVRIFRVSPDGRWSDVGSLTVHCRDAIEALRAGHVVLVPKTGRDVELAGRRQQLVMVDHTTCPSAPAR